MSYGPAVPDRPARDGARRRAFDALHIVREWGRGSQAALDQALRVDPQLSPEDRGLATELVYGVLRRRRALDAWLLTAIDRGLRGVDPDVLEILRLGAYQLAALDRVPDHAAIAATIDETRDSLGKRRVGFVNAVLRRLTRERPWRDGTVGDLPPWIAERVRRYAQDLNLDPDALEAAFCERAPAHVHVVAPAQDDALKQLGADGLEVAKVGDVPGTWEVLGGSPYAGRLFGGRQLIPQDGASAAIAEWLGAQAGEEVVDMCAGRGAKSLFLAATGAHVTAVDVGSERLAAAEELVREAGFALRDTVAADASQPLDAAQLTPGSFDRVLVDAPCTGLGTLRRRPEIRHRRRAADLPRNHALQRAILQQAAPLVRPGGELMYAVCSFAHEEGPLVIARFLAENPEFERARRDAQPAWVQPLLDAQGALRSHPLWHGVDAFYACKLVRRGASA